MNAIEITNLEKTYANGTQALKAINLTVKEGDFFALLGANGAGKTTIIGIMTGLVNKTGGTMKVFGYDLDTEMTKVKQAIGVVPQEFNFNQFEKVRDIVLTEAGFFGIPRKDACDDCERILKSVDLWDKRDSISRNLSGGMKRRLMIARALITRPRLLILDEPTAGVDVELRHAMWKQLAELNKQGTTILLTTHYLEEVERLCQHAAIIKEGSIIKNDRVKNLLNLVETENLVVHVLGVKDLTPLAKYKPVKIDEHTFEIIFDKKEHLNEFVDKLAAAGMELKDIRPKDNRLENLFLSVLRD
ncbi:MAG: ABC-2 type transport system ATP-binding protein [Candidatus Omnitrophota bacterium]|jgi:ABC-2 type transport system ATP-binding protein